METQGYIGVHSLQLFIPPFSVLIRLYNSLVT